MPPSPPGVGENLGFLAGGRREPTNPTRKRIERLRRIRGRDRASSRVGVTFGPQGRIGLADQQFPRDAIVPSGYCDPAVKSAFLELVIYMAGIPRRVTC